MLCAHERKEFQDFMKHAGRNLTIAAKIDDPQLWEAVLSNTLSALPSWLEKLEEENG